VTPYAWAFFWLACAMGVACIWLARRIEYERRLSDMFLRKWMAARDLLDQQRRSM